MGKLCLKYYLYYAIFASAYLGAGLMTVLTMGGVGALCKPICPLETSTGTSCVNNEGYCRAQNQCVTKSTLFQHTDSAKLEQNYNDGCYVCENGAVLWPKYWSPGELKWVTAPNCEAECPDGADVCPGRNGEDSKADMCYTVPAEMGLRGITVIVFWVLGIMYIVQGVGNAVCAAGMKQFAAKYSKDWQKLGKWESVLATFVKSFPRYNRYLNFGVMICVLMSIALIPLMGVCYDAVDAYGERTFFPQAFLITLLIVFIFVGTCVVGTVFRALVPFETPFFQPRMRPPESQVVAHYCIEPIKHLFVVLGP